MYILFLLTHMNIPKGSNMKINGPGGLHSNLDEMYKRKEGTEYKNISDSEKKLFEKKLTDVAKKKPTGSSFTAREKENLARSLWKDKQDGTITEEDRKDFKKIVDGLE